MPIDKFFTSGYKSKGVQSRKIVAAKMRRSWPESSQFRPKAETIQLWMKHGEANWFHVRDLTPEETAEELRIWKENNPGWQFKTKERLKRESSEPPLKEPGHGFGPPRKKWDKAV